MRARILAVAAVALLVAGAFFLPEMLLVWGDSQLLNTLQMESQDEEREGLAESIQLSVAEKLLLLRSGTLTVMDLDGIIVTKSAAGTTTDSEEATLYYTNGIELHENSPELNADSTEEIDRYNEEARQLWEARMEAAGAEIRTLQTLGGLPELWQKDRLPDYSGYGDLLYLDPGTYVSFEAYQITLLWEDYILDLLVDVQSGRILSFNLQLLQGAQPNWGLRGASNFGSAWRDYWKMDSVSTGWYNEYTRSILESVAQAAVNGDYAARDQISFVYDGRSLSVPLECQGSRVKDFSVFWNR